MGSHRAQQEKKVAELSSKTKLNKEVVQSLVERYNLKCKGKGIDRDSVRDDLMNQFGILDDFLLDRIFRTFDTCANTQHLSLDDYVLGMATFLTKEQEDKLKFCFSVYDLNGDGYIIREEMFQFLKNCMITKSLDTDQDDADEGIRDLTELALKKLDFDHDGRVSVTDFQLAVAEDKLLLECLGQCLPDEKRRCHCLKVLRDPEMNIPPSTMTHKGRHKSGRKDRMLQQRKQ